MSCIRERQIHWFGSAVGLRWTHRSKYVDFLSRVRESYHLGHRIRFFLLAAADVVEAGTVAELEGRGLAAVHTTDTDLEVLERLTGSVQIRRDGLR